MTRSFRRFMGACVAVVLAAAGASAQRGNDPPPDYATLKRLADQLGAGGQGQIDPEMLKFAQEFMKNNPDFLKDPRVQQQMAEMRRRFQQDPKLAENMKRQMNLSQDQLDRFRQQFQSQGGGSMGEGRMTTPNPTGRPPIGTPQLPTPPTPPTGQGPGQGSNPNSGAAEAPGIENRNPGGATQPNPGNGGGGFNNPSASQAPFTDNGQSLDQMKQLAQQNQEFGQLVGTWEANFGSLDNTPALRQAFIDMYSGGGGNWGGMNGSSNGFNWNGGSGAGGSGPGNWGGGNGNGGGGLAQWFNNATSNGGPSWWKSMTGGSGGKSWFSGWNTGGGGGGASSYTPSVGGGGIGSVGGLGGGFAGLGTAGLVIVGLIAAAVVAFLVYRYWPAIAAMRRPPTPLPGAGPWPIDPRDVKDRESLVRAFEYLSVYICGDGARVWNHVTIAEAIRENVPGAAGIADPLARLYAVARYTPTREPISPADIAEARRHLCRLAGVSEV